MLHDHAAEAPAAFGDELAPGTELCHGQYVIEKYLNSGGFGVTYLTRDSLERKVVIKECFPNAMCCRSGEMVRLRSRSFVNDFERVVELFEKEARALAHLQHANIVGVHQIFKDNGTAYMALDYVEGFDLLHIFETQPSSLSPHVIKGLLAKLLEALTYVHENGILHRDISPDNILLDHLGEPVLIDFGAARESASRASRVLSRVHTVKDGYSPQEFYFSGSAQSPSSDLYALAATFHHLIAGHAPTNSNIRLGAVAENKPDPYEPLEGRFADYDTHFLSTIDQCLSLFAKDRLESAAVWRDEIDETRRTAARLSAARDDTEIEKKIAKLVAQNRQMMEAENAAAEETEDPVEVVEEPKEDPKVQAEREYWAILNEDPSDWDAEAEEDEAVETEEPVIPPEKKSDFIGPLHEREAAMRAFYEQKQQSLGRILTRDRSVPVETPSQVTPSRPVTKVRAKTRPVSRSRLALSALMPWTK